MLVVDDDEMIRWLIAANLTLEGFDVAIAVEGRTAWTMCRPSRRTSSHWT